MTEEQITPIPTTCQQEDLHPAALRTDWKPEYAPELMAIEQELTALMKVKEQAHATKRTDLHRTS